MNIIIIILLLTGLHSFANQSLGRNLAIVKTITTTQALGSTSLPDTSTGIMYFSFDMGATWVNKSSGLPADLSLTDIAVSDTLLGLTTKQHGLFLFNFETNHWTALPTNPAPRDHLEALYFHNSNIFVGTRSNGIFVSHDKGQTWASYNNGLKNLTIRKLAFFNNTMLAATDAGFYSLKQMENVWKLVYGHRSLQVTGITEHKGELYIGTNQGAFKGSQDEKEWKPILPNHSLHNMGSDSKAVYALTYNELFASTDKGITWQSVQRGLPQLLYTFQLLQTNNTTFVGQWDGVYKKENEKQWTPFNAKWQLSSKGLPSRFAVTEMKVYKSIIVVGCSERTLRQGVTIEK